MNVRNDDSADELDELEEEESGLKAKDLHKVGLPFLVAEHH
ncbi:18228_t:CDS:2 [Entrophospora sp. SA101]|nr:18228_t:CDS:2 [Entrophospora sp. SA101]